MNFISKIWEHKKIVFFVFLFVILLASATENALGKIINVPSGSRMTADGTVVSTTPVTDAFDPLKFLGACAGLAVFQLIAAYTFALMAILLAARYAILAVLFILSPLAFFCWIFPPMRSLWTKWWENFIKWAFVGVSTGFFIYLAISVLEASKVGGKVNFNDIFVSFVFLIIGYKITTAVSPMVSQAVMGLAKGGVGLAMGAAGGVAGMSGLKGLAQRGGQALKDRATKAGERLGVVKKGTTEANRADRLSEPMKRLEAIQDNKELAKIAEQRPMTANKAAEKAAAAKILASRNAFNTIDPRKRDAVMAHAQAFGIAKDTFTKGSPELGAAATDKEAIAKVNADKVNNLVASGAYNRKEAEEKVKGYAAPTATEISQAHKDIRRRRITENALGISPITDTDVKNDLVKKHQDALLARGLSQEKAAEGAKRYSSRISDQDIAVRRESLGGEKVQKAVQKLSPLKASELPTEAINEHTMPHFSARQIQEVGDKGGTNLINEIAKYKPTTYRTASGKTAYSRTQSAEFKMLLARYKSLPKNSRERKQLKDAIAELATNQNI